MGCITPANGPIRLPRRQKRQTYAVAIIVYLGHAETTGHGRHPCKDAANAAHSEALALRPNRREHTKMHSVTRLTVKHWRCDTGTLYVDLCVSAVSVVPAGDYLAY